jgi:hypothetical protein
LKTVEGDNHRDNELVSNRNESVADLLQKLRSDRTALWVSVLSLLVAAVAALFTGLQWHEAREQRRLQAGAALSFEINTLAPKHRLGIGVHNAGPGVAHIQDVRYYVDGKVIEDADSVLQALGIENQRDEGIDLEHGDSLAPNDIVWLIDYRPKGRADEERVSQILENRVRVAIAYCTADGECPTACSEVSGCPVGKR